MARKAKYVLEELSHPGPHEVRRGDLALIGMPGLVYTPRAGLGLPAVAFGHGWLQPPGRYRALLRHLASWGIVVAAPATHRGPLPSHRLFAADLRTALDVCVGVRLGDGGISVDADRLGVAGHSIGGGAAVLAAADDTRVRGVATVAPAQTMPPATEAARGCAMPALHLAAENDLVAPAVGNAEAIARAWRGPVRLRTLAKATHLGVTEGVHWSQMLLQGKGEHRTQRLTRALFTAFFLDALGVSKDYRALLEEGVKGAAVAYSQGELVGA
ncbi:MAG: alpha/beta hydrolase [Pseudonocardiaceae bacterium]|nr:alpha/beta hydrolase [Pseudonocardiaceae bacterium]